MKGYRTLGVAVSEKSDFENIQFIGIITFADPIRNDSKHMIEEVKDLGIKPIMLTGDSLSIAKQIASQSSFGTI
jgi:H+-transporting ATPase